MYSSAVRKAIAGSKLAFIEKYGFAYPEDLDMLRDQFNAVIIPLDANRVRIEVGKRVTEAIVRQADASQKPREKGGWVEA